MNTNAESESYAKQLFDDCDDKEYGDVTPLIIDGINCDLRFQINNKRRSYMLEDPRIYANEHIFDNYVYHHWHKNIEGEITLEILTIFLKCIFKTLEGLVFDKSIGVLIEKKKRKKQN